MTSTSLRVVPLTLAAANALVARLHRHHRPVVGHRYSIGAIDAGGRLRGAAICGRPVARHVDQDRVIEVTRLVTDGTPNCCSHLMQAAARAGKELGFHRIQTYTLATEPGTSLRAAGWRREHTTRGGTWGCATRSRPAGREEPKVCWSRLLNPPAPESAP